MSVVVKFFLLLSIFFSLGMKDSGKTVRIGLSQGCPYICHKKSAGRGYVIEILQNALGKSGINFKHVSYPYVRLKHGLYSNQYDMTLLPSFEIRADHQIEAMERLFGVYFLGIASLESQSDITSLQDLKGKRVAVTRGSYYSDVIHDSLFKINKGKRFVKYITGSDVEARKVAMLLKKRVDYIFGDYNVLSYVIGKEHADSQIHFAPSSIAGFTPLVLAINSNSKEKKLLNRLLNSYIDESRQNGELQKILKRYNVVDWNLYNPR